MTDHILPKDISRNFLFAIPHLGSSILVKKLDMEDSEEFNFRKTFIEIIIRFFSNHLDCFLDNKTDV